MKKLGKKQNWEKEEKDEINKELSEIIKKLIKPVIDEETNIDILKVINRAFCKEGNITKIFSCCNNIFSRNNDNIINSENAINLRDIIHKLIIIFLKKNDESKYHKELKNILTTLFNLIKNSKTHSKFMSNNDSDNESYSIVYIYELFYNLFKSNDKIIVSNFIDNRIITTLIGQLESENKEIRNIIYDSVIYLIKQTNDYKKEYFELNEGEEEGKYNFEDKNTLKHSIDRSIVNILFEEKPELLNMLLTILEYDDENFGNEFIKETYRLFSEYEDKNKTEDLLNILFTQIKINDSYTFERLYKMMGYPSLVIKSIPREIKYKSTHNIYNNYDSDNDDAISDSDEDKEKKSPKKIQQKWPLFGEKLINGDINKQVYEYLCPNHKEKNICLLNLLFPSEYCEQKEKIKNKERENDDNDDEDEDEDEETNEKEENEKNGDKNGK